MKRPSLTLRLSLLFAAVSAAVLLAVGGVIWHQIDEHFEQLDLMDLQSKLDLARQALAENGSDSAALAGHLGHALHGHAGLGIRIERMDGTPWLALGVPLNFPESLRTLPAGRSLVWESGGERYRGVAAMIAAPGAEPAKRVMLALNLAHHADFIVTFRHTLVLALLLGIALSSLLGWWVARRGLQPIRDIAGLARRISAESLHDRLQLAAIPGELAELAAAFNAMLARLEDSFRRLSDFSSDIAHELRTPISNLLVQTQVAVSQARSAEEYREALYSNLEEYERLRRMVADMLFIAQAENGLVVPQRDRVDLAAEVDGLLEFHQALADEGGVGLLREGAAACAGDAAMLRRAIANLLANAIRHTAPGGVVIVRLGAAATGVEVSVENPGEAIAPEHLPRLFDRFYRADPSRQRQGEGSGLGLAIVKSIVEAHGGRVEAISREGRNRFLLILPAI